MKSIVKGLLVVALTIFLFAMSMRAFGGTRAEIEKMFEDKMLAHHGTCSVDEKGKIVKTEDAKSEVLCKSGYHPSQPTTHFVIVYDDKGEALKVIRLDTTNLDQEVIWQRGTSV